MTRTAEAGCKKIGKKCDKNKDCCDGAKCKGGKNGKCRCKSGHQDCDGDGKCENLNTDENNCGVCGNVCPVNAVECVAGTCAPGSCSAAANHCVSPFISCENDPDCVCLMRLETGETLCFSPPRCGQECEDDADCSGPGAFCPMGGESCCPGSSGQGHCAFLCGA